MPERIDAVITWVDGSDPRFVVRKRRALEEDQDYIQDLNASEPERYVNNDEIRYCIYLARLNAPWLNRIYLITDHQCPSWLDQETAESLGVVLVDHKEIFRDHLDYLPTFNSRSIETMMPRIPGLAERFIYFNDDVFLVRHVCPNDFFVGDGLIARGRWGIKSYTVEKKWRRFTFWHPRGYVCRRPGTALLPGWIRYIDIAHAPHALFKSDFLQLFDDDYAAKNIRYKFRADNQLSPVGFVINKMRKIRRVVRKDDDWLCLYPDNLLAGESICHQVARRKQLKFLCLQNLSRLTPAQLQKVYGELDALIAAHRGIASYLPN